jgi:hypothetical protein
MSTRVRQLQNYGPTAAGKRFKTGKMLTVANYAKPSLLLQMHSSDDDDIPVAIAARQHAARVLTSRGEHTNLSRAKTMSSHSTSNSQNSLARRKTEHHRRRELASDTLQKSNISSDSDTSGLMRGRSTTRTNKTHTAEVSTQRPSALRSRSWNF